MFARSRADFLLIASLPEVEVYVPISFSINVLHHTAFDLFKVLGVKCFCHLNGGKVEISKVALAFWSCYSDCTILGRVVQRFDELLDSGRSEGDLAVVKEV